MNIEFDYGAHLCKHPDLLDAETIRLVRELRATYKQATSQEAKDEILNKVLSMVGLLRLLHSPNRGKVHMIVEGLCNFIERSLWMKKWGLVVGTKVLVGGCEGTITSITDNLLLGIRGFMGLHSPLGITPLKHPPISP